MNQEISQGDWDMYSHILHKMIEQAIHSPLTSDIKFIRSLWDNETWSSIVRKYQTEGSTWVVWWQDGVNALILSEVG